MFRGSVLALALIFSAPTIWQALADQTISVQAAIIRFLIAVPIAAVLLGLVRLSMRRERTTPRSGQR
jgi:K+-sensing histidine kinase KdpD